MNFKLNWGLLFLTSISGKSYLPLDIHFKVREWYLFPNRFIYLPNLNFSLDTVNPLNVQYPEGDNISCRVESLFQSCVIVWRFTKQILRFLEVTAFILIWLNIPSEKEPIPLHLLLEFIELPWNDIFPDYVDLWRYDIFPDSLDSWRYIMTSTWIII